jgi:hypothetical protein
MRLSRRAILAAAAAVPAAAALGVGGAAARWWNKAPGDALSVLSDDEYAFAQALAEAWMPPGGVPALSGADADLGRWLDGLLLHLDPMQARALKAACQVLDDLPLTGQGAPFRQLPLEARIEILGRWMRSSSATFRGAISGLLLLLGMGWTTHPEVARVLAPMMGCGWGR